MDLLCKMGYEYRIKVNPQVSSIEDVCAEVFTDTEWKQIPSSLIDVPNGIGIQSGAEPVNSSWPHVADLYVEEDGQIYIVCHDNNGQMFLNALVEKLRFKGHRVVVDDDI